LSGSAVTPPVPVPFENAFSFDAPPFAFLIFSIRSFEIFPKPLQEKFFPPVIMGSGPKQSLLAALKNSTPPLFSLHPPSDSATLISFDARLFFTAFPKFFSSPDADEQLRPPDLIPSPVDLDPSAWPIFWRNLF